MLAEALNIAVQFTMKNHLYQFDGKVMRQKRGGPIGLGLTGDVAQIFMVWWDQQKIKKLEANGMRVLLYLRYVDDIIVVVRDMSVNQDVGGAQPRDETNMLKVQEVANTIHPSIQVTIDCPSRHEDAKMPVLDLNANPRAGQGDEGDHCENRARTLLQRNICQSCCECQICPPREDEENHTHAGGGPYPEKL